MNVRASFFERSRAVKFFCVLFLTIRDLRAVSFSIPLKFTTFARFAASSLNFVSDFSLPRSVIFAISASVSAGTFFTFPELYAVNTLRKLASGKFAALIAILSSSTSPVGAV